MKKNKSWNTQLQLDAPDVIVHLLEQRLDPAERPELRELGADLRGADWIAGQLGLVGGLFELAVLPDDRVLEDEHFGDRVLIFLDLGAADFSRSLLRGGKAGPVNPPPPPASEQHDGNRHGWKAFGRPGPVGGFGQRAGQGEISEDWLWLAGAPLDHHAGDAHALGEMVFRGFAQITLQGFIAAAQTFSGVIIR